MQYLKQDGPSAPKNFSFAEGALMAVALAVAGFGTLSSAACSKEKTSPLEREKGSRPVRLKDEAIAFANQHDLHLVAAEELGSAGVVYFPQEYHYGSMQLLHANLALNLRKSFGVGTICIEGDAPAQISPADVRERFEALKRLQDLGEFDQFEENEAELDKREPRRLESLEQFLSVRRIYALAHDRPDLFSIVGSEPSIGSSISLVQELRSSYRTLFQAQNTLRRHENSLPMVQSSIATTRDDLDNGIDTLKKEIVVLSDRISALGFSLPHRLPELKDATQQLQYLDEFDEVIELIHSKREEFLVDQLSSMVASGEQVMLVYGEAHRESLVTRFRKAGISFVVLDYTKPK